MTSPDEQFKIFSLTKQKLDLKLMSELRKIFPKIRSKNFKNISGRIPVTTRSENQFKRYPTTHQIKRAFTNLWLSWNKVDEAKK